jgi:hypothetical protein
MRRVQETPTREKDEMTRHGLLTFSTLMDALEAGYQIYDRTPEGYLVRTRTHAGWALARVVVR